MESCVQKNYPLVDTARVTHNVSHRRNSSVATIRNRLARVIVIKIAFGMQRAHLNNGTISVVPPRTSVTIIVAYSVKVLAEHCSRSVTVSILLTYGIRCTSRIGRTRAYQSWLLAFLLVLATWNAKILIIWSARMAFVVVTQVITGTGLGVKQNEPTEIRVPIRFNVKIMVLSIWCVGWDSRQDFNASVILLPIGKTAFIAVPLQNPYEWMSSII